MLGIGEEKEIEKYVKNNMGIKEYSFHHILTFIKLFISQHSEMEKLEFWDSNGNDITPKCKKNFAETTKYFTNGGFARLLMMKNDNNKNDEFDLYSKAYNSDLNNGEFKTVFYLDSTKKKYNFIDLGETTQEQEKKNKREVDIVYLVDATGSMGPEINAANQHVIRIFNDLKEKYKKQNKDFNFGVVFYRDQALAKKKDDDYYIHRNESGFFQLTNNMENLKRYISTINPQGGLGYGGDWVEGYEFALNKIKWREGLKLIIHIADDGAHGEEFQKGDPLPEEGPKLIKQINKVVEKNINIVAFKIGNYPKQSFERTKEVYDEHKILKKKNNQFMEIYEFNRGKHGEESSNEFLKLVKEAIDEVADPSYFYLKRLKQLLNLPNDINNDIEIQGKQGKEKLLSLLSILNLENEEDYVITDDNFKKMVLLIYRIQADVPVIIMGETGCGKTALITKLNQIINNGKKLLGIIKIHPGINDEKICEEMKEMNKSAKEKRKEGKEQWVFFDEINTCSSLTLLKEIFINRTFNGEKLEDNIRLIGACNPYRKKLNAFEKCGLTVEDDEDDKDDKDDKVNNLVYKVQPLPQSLLYYTFSFGSITKEDEKKYIKSIIRKLFNMDDEYEKKLHEFTTDALSECHEFLRKSYGEKAKGKDDKEEIIKEPSIVSLRDMNRFKSCVKFFQDYFLKKHLHDKKNDINETIEEQKKVNKIKSIICSIYLCYYIRIIDKDIRSKFDTNLRKLLFKLVNVYSGLEDSENFKYKPLIDDINKNTINGEIKRFSDFLKIEEEFLLNQIDLENGIGKNDLLKENVFSLFLSVVTKIPVIIVGKPGTGKSLSAKLIINSMKGKYSKKDFFKEYPSIIQIYFQGSKSNTPEDVEKLFSRAENLLKNYKNKNKKILPIYMILFDELGLAEKSKLNPLKVLHHKLEYDGKNEGVCFIGISNYTLDAAKLNRALCLSIPNLEDQINELRNTAKAIISNISSDLGDDKNMIIFNILSRAYYDFKKFIIYIKKRKALIKFLKENKNLNNSKISFNEIEMLQDFKNILKREKKIKTEFFGNRDFYNIIKCVAIEGSKLEDFNNDEKLKDIIEKFIERNFGGTKYEVDLNFDFKLAINDEENFIKILGDDKFNTKKKKIKVTSVEIFKRIYNLSCEKGKEKHNNYKIKIDKDNKYDLNRCINDNINDYNSRYLLLEINSNIAPLIIENIKIQNPEKKKNIKFINGSLFSDDDNNEYRFKKINEILDSAEKGEILIIQNLNQIQPYLYDLYNMNYKIIDGRKFVRICLENLSDQDTPVNDSFRIINFVDKDFINSVDMAFLNRLEKMQINFKSLLNDDKTILVNDIIKEIGFKKKNVKL